jgi:phage terminase large subunit-like protein
MTPGGRNARFDRLGGARGVLPACDDQNLFCFPLWPRQRKLLAAVESGPRLHVWALGRRSGKTTMAALIGLADCLLRPELDALVRPGERRYSVAVATNVRQARLFVSAARAIVERSPLLSKLVENVADDEITFTNGTALAAFPCTSRGVRGWPISSTPYGQDGLFAETYQRASSGELQDAKAHHATTAQMNPTVTREFLEQERERDPDSFASEYLAEFLAGGLAFIERDRLLEVVADRRELPPADLVGCVVGFDPSFSRDPAAVAVVGRHRPDRKRLLLAHAERWVPTKKKRWRTKDEQQDQERLVLDAVARLAKRYQAKVVTDVHLLDQVRVTFPHAGPCGDGVTRAAAASSP